MKGLGFFQKWSNERFKSWPTFSMKYSNYHWFGFARWYNKFWHEVSRCTKTKDTQLDHLALKYTRCTCSVRVLHKAWGKTIEHIISFKCSHFSWWSSQRIELHQHAHPPICKSHDSFPPLLHNQENPLAVNFAVPWGGISRNEG